MGSEVFERSTPATAAPKTLRNQWFRHPAWPDPVDKRGQAYVYDPSAVDEVIAEHFASADAGLQPGRLYTARELEAAGVGVTAGTIRADLARGRWPAQTTPRAARTAGRAPRPRRRSKAAEAIGERTVERATPAGELPLARSEGCPAGNWPPRHTACAPLI